MSKMALDEESGWAVETDPVPHLEPRQIALLVGVGIGIVLGFVISLIL